jgi:hypothetical protein
MIQQHKMIKVILYIIIIAITVVGGYLIVKKTAQAPSSSPLPSAQKPSGFIGPTGNPPTPSSSNQPFSSSSGINH